MENFRFCIMGAGRIANKFCDAVGRIPGAEVAAIASKSIQRAEEFARRNGIGRAYGDYEEMLEKERPDCVYIAVVTGDHFRLCMLCAEHGVPVLCEKAMFTGSREADAFFAEARRRQVFAMEALWSFFLPTVRKAKQWIEEGNIGEISYMDFSIGFLADKDPENRYFSRKLGGGAAYDITVYAYEITAFLMNRKPLDMQVSAVWGETGVDETDHVTLIYPDCIVAMTASIAAPMEEKMVIYGSGGKIVLPLPHVGSEAFLYGRDQELKEHFRDEITENGFTYEIREAMDCIRAGRLESGTASWERTLECAALFDRIGETGKKC